MECLHNSVQGPCRAMNRALIIAISLTLALLLAGCRKDRAAAKHAIAEQEIRQLEQQWADAELKRDTAFFERVMTDSYLYTAPSNIVMTKAELLASSKPLPPDVTSVSANLDDLKVRIYGDTAIVTGIVMQRLQFPQGNVSGKYRYTKVYVKQNGSWQAAAMQAAVTAPEQPPR
jgi:ketosteroid isomerase-like protein